MWQNLLEEKSVSLKVRKVQSDAAKLGRWGGHCQDLSAGGLWSKEESQFDINVIESKAAKMVTESFTKLKKFKSIHLQINDIVALTYLIKMAGTKIEELKTKLRNGFGVFCFQVRFQLQENLPSTRNIQTDWIHASGSCFLKNSTKHTKY